MLTMSNQPSIPINRVHIGQCRTSPFTSSANSFPLCSMKVEVEVDVVNGRVVCLTLKRLEFVSYYQLTFAFLLTKTTIFALTLSVLVV